MAVSGGPDSIALTHSLHDYLQDISYEGQLHALIVDHGLRAESEQEAQDTAELLQKLNNVTPYILKWDGDKPAARIQEEARNTRYNLMAQHCAKHNISSLFLGHHRDDQAETILFRLAGGSGLKGLGGMKMLTPYKDMITLVRPFLDLPKDDLIKYCNNQDISYAQDPSNQNDHFARVRLRQSMNILESEGLTSQRLCTTAKRLARAEDALQFYSHQAFTKALKNKNTNSIVFNKNLLLNNHLDIINRIITQSIIEIIDNKNRPPRTSQVESICEDLIAIKPFRARTLGGLYFRRDDKNNQVVICREESLALRG